MPSYTPSDILPNGFDRADGLQGRPGTVTPLVARLLNGQQWAIETSGSAQRFLEELPDSPTIERGEQGTVVHKFRCDQQTAIGLITSYGRGSEFEDDQGNTTRVVTSRYEQGEGNVCTVTITAESTSFDLTPPEITYDTIELNPSLTKHPRYSILSRLKLRQILNTYSAVNSISEQDWNNVALSGLDGQALNAAKELLAKLRKGFDSFHLAGIRVNYSTYNYFPQDMNFGGYVETPWEALDNALPAEYFTNQNGQNIFTNFASAISPMLYGNGITWLRLADTQSRQRTWWRITQSWIGAPAGGTVHIAGNAYEWKGIWDEDIYEREFTNYNTSEFQ